MSCNPIKEIDIQGHRGCRGLLPENSLPAFEKAIDLGVNTLELDIAITKDNEVIVSHEPYINPVICFNPNKEIIPDTMDKAYNIYKMSHNEIKKFDCGTKFHPSYPKQEKFKVYKPLLTEVFELVRRKKSSVRFNIEIKSQPDYYGIYTPEPERYVRLVLETIKSSGFIDRINLQSFDMAILEEIKVQSPSMEVALLIDDIEDIDDKLKAMTYEPEIISPFYKLLSKANVDKYHVKGYKVIPWTVNTQDDMSKMIDLNVDGIITDYPDILIALLKN